MDWSDCEDGEGHKVCLGAGESLAVPHVSPVHPGLHWQIELMHCPNNSQSKLLEQEEDDSDNKMEERRIARVIDFVWGVLKLSMFAINWYIILVRGWVTVLTLSDSQRELTRIPNDASGREMNKTSIFSRYIQSHNTF